jgi:hypothetical protein
MTLLSLTKSDYRGAVLCLLHCDEVVLVMKPSSLLAHGSLTLAQKYHCDTHLS